MDLIVFGATGFSGSVAVEYFARHISPSFTWAVVGRNAEKLATLKARLQALPVPPGQYHVADLGDASAVGRLIGQARVAINFAGPFARYGENVLAACAELGTHYLDITGETLWVRQMMERYEAQAKRSGALLLPFAGFDSVPSDLGAWKAEELGRGSMLSERVSRVVGLYQVRGGVNGGTFETMLDLLSYNDEDRRRFHDPALLVPGELRDRFVFRELKRPVRVPEAGDVLAPPFFMAPINSRVVYRSQALRLAQQEQPFEYQELVLPRPGTTALEAWTMAAGAAAFERFGRKPWARALLKKYGVKSGQGPSRKAQQEGFFRARFYAYEGDRYRAGCELSYDGDPGNRATALFSCESALCLMTNPALAQARGGGFWTPSTALGETLLARLQRAGLRYQVLASAST